VIVSPYLLCTIIDSARKMKKGVGGQWGSNWIWLVVGILGVIGAVVIVVIRKYYAEAPAREAGRNLFEALVSLHDVTASEKRLLKKIADEYGLADSALCFVKPSFLLDALERSALGGGGGRRRADRLAAVCRKLFGVASKHELESMEV